MMKPIVFYSRCKPQDVDAIDIVISENRLFIGHPMVQAGVPYNPRNLKACVVDPSCPDKEWEVPHAASDKRRQFNQNRNLVRKVTVGSIAMVPRPNRGLIYCGRVISKFELVAAPPWYDQYMQMRGDQDSDAFWHAADRLDARATSMLTDQPYGASDLRIASLFIKHALRVGWVVTSVSVNGS
jgi:hypothetical protein